MQFKSRRFGKAFVFAGLLTALTLGILGVCSRKIAARARLVALDIRAKPHFDEARNNIPDVVKSLTSFGTLCRLCWYMPRDKLTGSRKAQEYLRA